MRTASGKKVLLVTVALATMTVASGCSGMIRSKLTDTVDGIWNRRQYDLIDANYTPEAAKKVHALVDEKIGEYPDLKLTIEEVAVDGSLVAARWTATGTHRVYKKTVTIHGVTWGRLDGTKVAEEIPKWDTLDEKRQLGFTVTPPPTP